MFFLAPCNLWSCFWYGGSCPWFQSLNKLDSGSSECRCSSASGISSTRSHQENMHECNVHGKSDDRNVTAFEGQAGRSVLCAHDPGRVRHVPARQAHGQGG